MTGPTTKTSLTVSAAFSTGDPRGIQARGAHIAVSASFSSQDAKAAGAAVKDAAHAQASANAQVRLTQAGVTLSAAATALTQAGTKTGDGRLQLAGEITAQLGGVTLKVKGDLQKGLTVGAALSNPLGIPGLKVGVSFRDGAISLQAAYNLSLRSNDPALINAAPHLKLAASLAMSAATGNSKTDPKTTWALQVGLSYASSVASGAIGVRASSAGGKVSVSGSVSTPAGKVSISGSRDSKGKVSVSGSVSVNSATGKVSVSGTYKSAAPDTRFSSSARLQLASNMKWLGLSLDLNAKLGGPK